LNALGKLVADIIVEAPQNAGVKHWYGVVDDTILHGVERGRLGNGEGDFL